MYVIVHIQKIVHYVHMYLPSGLFLIKIYMVSADLVYRSQRSKDCKALHSKEMKDQILLCAQWGEIIFKEAFLFL